jgi:hypothetical protein
LTKQGPLLLFKSQIIILQAKFLVAVPIATK